MIWYLKGGRMKAKKEKKNRIGLFVVKQKLPFTGQHVCLFFRFGNSNISNPFSSVLEDWKCCRLFSMLTWSVCFYNLYLFFLVCLYSIWSKWILIKILKIYGSSENPTIKQKKTNHLFNNWIWIHYIFIVVSKSYWAKQGRKKGVYLR